jgi:hypothetical protein
LVENGQAIAVFEAKYSSWRRGEEFPRREHVFQVLTSAAAAGAPTAVLVYPGRFGRSEWKVQMAGGAPDRLVCLGLDMFGVVRSEQEDERARAIAALLGLIRVNEEPFPLPFS